MGFLAPNPGLLLLLLLLLSPSFVLSPRSISGTEKTRKFLGRGHYIGDSKEHFFGACASRTKVQNYVQHRN